MPFQFCHLLIFSALLQWSAPIFVFEGAGGPPTVSPHPHLTPDNRTSSFERQATPLAGGGCPAAPPITFLQLHSFSRLKMNKAGEN